MSEVRKRGHNAPSTHHNGDVVKTNHSKDDEEREATNTANGHAKEHNTTSTHSPHSEHQKDKAGEDALGAKTRHNHPFALKLMPSVLSSDNTEHNFRGLVHVAGLILFVTNFRLVLENLLKYGILINTEVLRGYMDWRSLPWISLLPLFIIASLYIEKQTSKGKFTEKQSLWLHGINLFSVLGVPSLIVHFSHTNPQSGIVFLFLAAILFLKLVSYSLANRDYRRMWLNKEPTAEEVEGVHVDELVSYPDNLTVLDMSYFIVAPTLCYQMNFPRSKSIRWYWLTGKFLQFIFFVCLMIFMVEQYCFPVVKNSVKHLEAGYVPGIIERVLKLSVPSLYIWLLMFYSFFHLWLNILAEVLRFGHRQFYLDWWNATTMDYYWRTWNIPTHHWLVRHIYFPSIRAGFSKRTAAIIVFVFSAVFHELLISVPLHTFKLYFFFGMMAQIPALFFGKYFQGSVVGNLMFWITFCFVGQPIGILLYYFDYTSDILKSALVPTVA